MADGLVASQIRLVIEPVKVKIARAILAKVQEVWEIKYTSFDKIKLLASDFQEHELPAVQLIDVAETIEHEAARAKKTWQIALELVMRTTDTNLVNQEALWSLHYQLERKLWKKPNLGIPGVIHLRYLGSVTDLHLLEPFYFVRMDFEALYYEHLVMDC